MDSQQGTLVTRRKDGSISGGANNPSGLSSEEYSKLRLVRRYALERSLEATDKLLDIMRTEDDSKVSLAAAVTVLKLAGCFNEKAQTDDALVDRINELAAEERARRAAAKSEK